MSLWPGVAFMAPLKMKKTLVPFILRMPQTAYDHFNMQLLIDGEAVSMEGRHMNPAAGNIAGHTTGIEDEKPFVMIRK